MPDHPRQKEPRSMGDILIDFIIILADLIGFLGGLLAMYQVTKGPAVALLSLVGSVLLLFPFAALFVSTSRGARSLASPAPPEPRQPDREIDPETKRLQKLRTGAVRVVASLLFLAVVFAFALYVASRNQNASIVVFSTWAIYIVLVLVASMLFVKAWYLDVKLDGSSRWYAIGPPVAIVGPTLIMADYLWNLAPLDAIGLIVGIVGLLFNVALLVIRVIELRRRRRRA